MSIKIYTDGGSTRANSDEVWHAGWGACYVTAESTYLNYGACALDDTNNRAEGRAFMEVLETILRDKLTEVTVYLDSKYILDSYTKYMFAWKRRNWRKADEEPVKNPDMWAKFHDLQEKVKSAGLTPTLNWVKGHSDVYGNEMADQGATKGIALAYAGDFETKTLILTGGELDAEEEVGPTESEPSLAVAFENGNAFVVQLGCVYKKAPEISITVDSDETVVVVKKVTTKSFTVACKSPTKKGSFSWTAVGEVKPVKLVVIPPNPLLAGRRVLAVTNKAMTESASSVYYTVSFDDTKDIKSRGLGVDAADRFEGVSFLNEPCAVLDMIHAKQEATSPSDYTVPVLYMWDKISSLANWSRFTNEGEACILPYRNDLRLDDKDTQLSHFLMQPRRALDAVNSLDSKAQLLKDVLEAKADYFEVVPLTSSFFTMSDEGLPVKANPDLAKARTVVTDYVHDGRKNRINMTFDFEIPGRGTYARLLKFNKGVAIDLIIFNKVKGSFRWALMISTSTGAGLYSNPSTNLIIVP